MQRKCRFITDERTTGFAVRYRLHLPEDLPVTHLQQIRASTWPILALTITVYSGACLFVNTVLLQGQIGQILGTLYTTTAFLIHSTLVGGVFVLVLTGAVVFGVGRCRTRDVGWHGGVQGMFVVFAFWLVTQGLVSAIEAFRGQMAWNADWLSGGSIAVGGVLGQLLGNALAEETVFRGFLLPQLYLKAAGRFTHGPALAIAVLGSSLLFALTHVPNLLFVKAVAVSDLITPLTGLFVLGSLFAAVYLITQNLFVVIGLHALLNNPAQLVRSSEVTLNAIWFGLTVLLLIAWPRIKWRRTRIDIEITASVSPSEEECSP